MRCPHCEARYFVVRVEADSTGVDREITCLAAAAPSTAVKANSFSSISLPVSRGNKRGVCRHVAVISACHAATGHGRLPCTSLGVFVPVGARPFEAASVWRPLSCCRAFIDTRRRQATAPSTARLTRLRQLITQSSSTSRFAVGGRLLHRRARAGRAHIGAAARERGAAAHSRQARLVGSVENDPKATFEGSPQKSKRSRKTGTHCCAKETHSSYGRFSP
jgi:hypothetical protein